MRRACAVAWVLAAACGRIGFDETGHGAGVAVAYSSDYVDAVLGVTAVDVAPVVAGGPFVFEVAPALPEGLVLDADTGAITGTPTEVTDGRTFTVTAAGDRGAAHVALRITVLPGFVVDSTADAPDDDGGLDGVCRAAAAGGCTLRAAVQTANKRTSRQLVLLDARAYALGSTLGAVTNDFVIAGRGAAATEVRAATLHPNFGMLYIEDGSRLALRGVAFRDFGRADGAVVAVKQGALAVDLAAFTNNISDGAGGVFYVINGSSAVIERSTFKANTSLGGCCGGWGGVIDGEGAGTSIVVRGCTATENTAAWGSFSHITSGTTLQLENSTLYKNTATTAGTLASPGGAYVLINDTIAYNRNTNEDSAAIFLYSPPASYEVSNTIVAFNTDATGHENNCNHRIADTRLISRGGNLVSDGAGNCAMDFGARRDRLGVDPGLDPRGLAENGGPTSTVLLAPASAAIDGAGAPCPATDQRGIARSGAPLQCESGAVEMP
jgi:CSLREA domain-containing protein